MNSIIGCSVNCFFFENILTEIFSGPSTAPPGRDCCDSASSVSPRFFGTRWLGTLPSCLFAGSQLSCICGECGGGAEETASRLKNLNNSWRQRGQVSAMCFFLLYSLCRQCLVVVVVVECFLLCCRCCWKCCYILVVMVYCPKSLFSIVLNLVWLEEELVKKKKKGFIFKLFIQKKNIGLTHMFDRGYILWSLCSHLNAGPFPPQHTWIHCIERGVMQLQQWILLCQLPSDPTILKLHWVKQTALHISI